MSSAEFITRDLYFPHQREGIKVEVSRVVAVPYACSSVTLSRQCMYWPCQWGYLFGELVAYTPAKWEVPGLTRPACAGQPQLQWHPKGTTRGQSCLYMCGIVVARGQHCSYMCSIVVMYESKEVEKRLLDESDSCLSKGMGGRSCESPHSVEFWCCTATAWWSEPRRCWLCTVFKDKQFWQRRM